MGKQVGALAMPECEENISLENNPTLRGLLDHIAEELAKEYVRLMKEAASVGTESGIHPHNNTAREKIGLSPEYASIAQDDDNSGGK